MKVFEVPQVEVIRFEQVDVLTSSCLEDVPCKTCPGCPPGSYDCGCYDFGNT
jgi:hypothetical protein